jgi:hypothetical protein
MNLFKFRFPAVFTLISMCCAGASVDGLPVLAGITPTAQKSYVYLKTKDGLTFRVTENDTVDGYKVLKIDTKADAIELEKGEKRYELKLNESRVLPVRKQLERSAIVSLIVDTSGAKTETEKEVLEAKMRIRAVKTADELIAIIDTLGLDEKNKEVTLANLKSGNFTYSAPGDGNLSADNLPPILGEIKASELAQINKAIDDARKRSSPGKPQK